MGLCAADHTIDAPSRIRAEFGDLSGLAGTGFTGDDHHLMVSNRIDDLILLSKNRQGIVVIQRTDVPDAPVPSLDGSSEPFLQIDQFLFGPAARSGTARGAFQTIEFLSHSNPVFPSSFG